MGNLISTNDFISISPSKTIDSRCRKDFEEVFRSTFKKDVSSLDKFLDTSLEVEDYFDEVRKFMNAHDNEVVEAMLRRNDITESFRSALQRFLIGIRDMDAIGAVSLAKETVFNIFDEYYTNSRLKLFTYCYKEHNWHDTEHIDKHDIMDIFDEMEDMAIDIKDLSSGRFLPFRIQVTKAAYLYNGNRGTDLPVINVALTAVRPDGTSMGLCEYAIVKGVYPSLYVFSSRPKALCPNGCSVCINTEISLTDTGTGISKPVDAMYISSKKVTDGRCCISQIHPHEICKIIAYIWDSYTHRKTVTRKNSPRKSAYADSPVDVTEREYTGKKGGIAYVDVPLHSYYYYEREKKGWQGGHHESPVEHVRKAHRRVYRNSDGSIKKVVDIGSMVVNKGGKKAVYTVKEPDKNT